MFREWFRRLAELLKTETTLPTLFAPAARRRVNSMDAPPRTIDIGRQRIGAVYGTALLRACQPNVDGALAELQTIVQDVFEHSPKLETLLGSPRVSADEKLALLDRLFRGRICDPLLRFLKVVCQHDRLDCLRDIYREAHRLRNEQQGIMAFDMITARAVDDATARHVAAELKRKFGSEIELRTFVNPSLLGGVMFRTRDKVYDASIARKLQLMRDDAIRQTAQSLRQNAAQFSTE